MERCDKSILASEIKLDMSVEDGRRRASLRRRRTEKAHFAVKKPNCQYDTCCKAEFASGYIPQTKSMPYRKVAI